MFFPVSGGKGIRSRCRDRLLLFSRFGKVLPASYAPPGIVIIGLDIEVCIELLEIDILSKRL